MGWQMKHENLVSDELIRANTGNINFIYFYCGNLTPIKIIITLFSKRVAGN